MFGTTSREEIYGRRPSESTKAPPAPLLAFRDFSKEAAAAAAGGGTHEGSGVKSPVHDPTDRKHHIASSRSELYGRRPSLVGADGRVPPSGNPVNLADLKKGAPADNSVFEEDEGDDKAKIAN